MKVVLGSNDFFGVPFPLVLADRFFHIYDEAGTLKLDIFRWDEEKKNAVYEIIASNPQTDNITTNPTGIVTFSHPDSKTFLYKFRLKPNISQIFGRIPVSKEFEVRITDRAVKVMADNREMCTLKKNQFSGLAIGIQVGADGSLSIGVTMLPEGMVLERRKS